MSPTPDEYSEYVSMDLKLSAVHQQFITREIAEIKGRMAQQDLELMVLAIICIGFSMLLGYAEFRIRRLEDGNLKEPTGRIRRRQDKAD